ncbi:hypothetical protein WG909_14700 [Peptostreptococcaceae bacterium AGR-M142]
MEVKLKLEELVEKYTNEIVSLEEFFVTIYTEFGKNNIVLKGYILDKRHNNVSEKFDYVIFDNKNLKIICNVQNEYNCIIENKIYFTLDECNISGNTIVLNAIDASKHKEFRKKGYYVDLTEIKDIYPKCQDTKNQRENSLQKLYEKYNNNEFFKTTITSVKKDFTMVSLFPGGIEGIITKEEGFSKTPEISSMLNNIGKEFLVKIVEFDEENDRVYLSMQEARETYLEERYLLKLDELKNKIGYEIEANIIGYNNMDSSISLDLGNGVKGYIPAEHWIIGKRVPSILFDMNSYIKKNGRKVNIRVLEYKESNEKFRDIFICSRAATMIEKLNALDKIDTGDYFKIKVIDYYRKPDSTNAKGVFGNVLGLDVDILCFFPDKDDNVTVRMGGNYIVEIIRKNNRSSIIGQIKKYA